MARLWSSDLDEDSVKRYSRQVIVPGVGINGQKRIQNTRVLVVGAGGLGSPVLTYLVMGGVGAVGVADFDKVEIHNIQRQSLYGEEDIGRQKAETAVAFLKRFNSGAKITEHTEKISERNILKVARGYDILVDCTDSVSARYLINDVCRILNKPLVAASVLRWEGQIYVIPKEGCCFRCMFPEKKESAASCDTSGVIGAMCGVVGAMQATEVIKMILCPPETSSIMLYNGKNRRYLARDMVRSKCELCLQRETGALMKLSESSDGACSGKCGQPEDGEFSITWDEILANMDEYAIVDIRDKTSYALFRVANSVNMPGVEERLDELEQFGGKKLIISCYRGKSSKGAAKMLRFHGVPAFSAVGGLVGFKAQIGFG